MPRSPRNACAILGWLAIASVCLALFVGVALGQVKDDVPRDSEQTPAEAAARQENPSPLPIIPPEPAEPVTSPEVYEPNCDTPESREDADLCAQRRMAKAAEDTLKWVRESVGLAESQLLATIGEIIALIVIIGVAGIAVGAAFKANKLSKESAERQLRTYVGLASANIQMHDDGSVAYNVRFMNTGQTPGYYVSPRTTFAIAPYPLRQPLPRDDPTGKRSSLGIIHQGQSLNSGGTMPGKLTLEYRDDIAAGTAAMFLHGEVAYRDAFGRPQNTAFRLMYTGPWGGQKPLEVCEEGNDAT